MTESTQAKETEVQKKKLSLKEAMKQQLEAKKNQVSENNSSGNPTQSTKKMKSQQTKKVSNTRRKMGV